MHIQRCLNDCFHCLGWEETAQGNVQWLLRAMNERSLWMFVSYKMELVAIYELFTYENLLIYVSFQSICWVEILFSYFILFFIWCWDWHTSTYLQQRCCRVIMWSLLHNSTFSTRVECTQYGALSVHDCLSQKLMTSNKTNSNSLKHWLYQQITVGKFFDKQLRLTVKQAWMLYQLWVIIDGMNCTSLVPRTNILFRQVQLIVKKGV